MKRRRRRSGALEANDFEELLQVRLFKRNGYLFIIVRYLNK